MAVIPVVNSGQDITAAWGNLVGSEVNAMAVGPVAYIPTLTGMVIGTGGSALNSAAYVFNGQQHVGAYGHLTIFGNVVFGTSGQTFPTAPTIALPAGFNFYSVTGPTHNNFRVVGRAELNDSGTETYEGLCLWNSATTFQVWAERLTSVTHTGTVQAYLNRIALSTAIPMSWAAGDGIYYTAQFLGVRV